MRVLLHHPARLIILFLLFATFPLSSRAQAVSDGNQNLPAFGSFSGSDFDIVSLQNGNLHLHIPLGSWTQRGGKTASLFFTYDTPSWTRQTTITTVNRQRVYMTQVNPGSGGWAFVGNVGGWGLQSPISTGTCPGTHQQDNLYNQWILTDPEGTKHPLDLQTSGDGCLGNGTKSPTMDGSGIIADIGTNPMVTLKDGTQIPMTKFTPYVFGSSGTREDTNGNLITSSVTDTLNRTLVTNTSGSGYNLYTVHDSNGNSQVYRIDWATPNIVTNFCGSLENPPIFICSENGGNFTLPAKLTLPDGQFYTFNWNNGTSGELASVILPTGATISYSYFDDSTTCSHGPLLFGQNSTTAPYNCSAHVLSRTVTVNGVPSTWTYSGGTVTDPMGNDEAHVFSQITINSVSSPNTVETQASYYQGHVSGGTLLKQVKTDYTGEPDTITPVLLVNIRPIRVTTTLDNGLVTKTETDYETFSLNGITATRLNPTETREYAYGNGAPGALLRRTDYTYLHNNNSTYATLNIVNRPASVIVYDGSGNIASQTTYEYDVYNHSGLPSMAASGAVQHDSARSTSYTARGNRTATSRWRNTDGVWLTGLSQYDDAGSIIASKDPGGNLTQFDYTDSWISITGTTGGNACAPAGQGKAFPTRITNALSQATTHTYYSCTGALGSTTDPNNLTSWNVYDLLGRTVQAHAPDGGVTTNCFTDMGGTGCTQSAPPFQSVTTKSINSAAREITTIVFDGLARPTQTQLNSDPQGTVYTSTTYDPVGRVASVSNPYRSGSDPTTSAGTTMYSYDALNRKTAVTYPDNSALQTAYCGKSTLATDPTGRWRRSITDALGRLVEVDEPNAVGATVNSNGCVGTGEPIWLTSYSYDTLGNLTNVVQNGSHQRTFTYNSLSQLLTSANPEVGIITYTYDADGNVSTKRDARSITTTYGYDVLNREISRSYSNGDPTITTTYDQSACLGLTACQNVGHRTSVTDAAGSEAWSYQVDTTNHRSVHVDQRTTNSSPSNVTKTATYYLDLAGNVTQVVYPTGRVVNYTFDAANRPSTAADASNGITYAAAQATPPSGCLSVGVCYTPQGSEYSAAIDKTSTFTGVNVSETYNNRLQPLEIKASSSAGNAIDITYTFVDPSTLKNAGHVYSIVNNLNSSRTQSFMYDQVNRIITAGTTATSGTYCWGYLYNYDAWGNLLYQQGWSPNYNGCSEATMGSVTADGNNHISGFSYDSSGNTQNDGTISYSYDAESQMKTANGVTYAYDGDGRRVYKSNGKLYWYGAGGDILAETDGSGNTLNEYVFFGGKRIAMLPAGGNPAYYVEDMLGTSRVITQNNGTVCYDADFDPYGGEHPYTNTCPQNYKFEGKERDTETGNDDYGARYYTSRFGRWLSADWSSVPVPVPYANLTNPQTLNLYSMVADDPESFADLDGHADDSISTIIQDAVLTAIGTWASDNLFGALRPNPDTLGGKMGQAIGDFAAQQSGIAEAEAGASLTPPALVLAGGGQVEALAVPAGLVAHGTVTAGIGTINLAKDAAETSSSGKPYENTPQNKEQMKQGNAPTGADGHPVELHHEGQKPNGPVKEMTRTEHRGGENFKKNHPNTGQKPSQINRHQAQQQKRKHWKNKANQQD
jgi:RHS repeat-associated protein